MATRCNLVGDVRSTTRVSEWDSSMCTNATDRMRVRTEKEWKLLYYCLLSFFYVYACGCVRLILNFDTFCYCLV